MLQYPRNWETLSTIREAIITSGNFFLWRISLSRGVPPSKLWSLHVPTALTAGLPGVADLLGILDDSLLATGLSLFVGHSDLPGLPVS
jgi:hypothetical protein